MGHGLQLPDVVGICEWYGELLGAEHTMRSLWLLLEECLPAFAPPFAQLSGQFFGFAFQGVLQADAVPAQKIAIAVEPSLDVGGGCFVRACAHDQLWPLALKGLVCLAWPDLVCVMVLQFGFILLVSAEPTEPLALATVAGGSWRSAASVVAVDL